MGAYGGITAPTQQSILRHACGGIQQQDINIPPQVFEAIWGPNIKGAKSSGKNTLGTAPPAKKKSDLELGISGRQPPQKGEGDMAMSMYGGGGYRGMGGSRQQRFGGGVQNYSGGSYSAPAMLAGRGAGGGGWNPGMVPSAAPQAPQQQAPAAPQLPTQPSAGISMPPGQQFTPYNPQQAQQLNQNMQAVSGAGQGLLEPGSDYYQQLSQAMQRQIGGQSAAQQRSAALRAAQSGLGAGASPELMMTTGDIAQGGLEAQGMAEAGLALQAPQLGAGMLQSTFSPMLGLQQMAESSKQFGAGMGEQQRQFGTNTAMQQQQMAAQQAWQQAQLQAQQQAQQQEALMRQYQMMFGMF